MKVNQESELAQFIRERGPHCLIIARHGETGWNAEGRLQGQRDTSLNARGVEQALTSARFLKNVPIKRIHCSTLERCRRTAISIAEINISRPDIEYCDSIKETALGILEGEMKSQQSTAELTEHYRSFSDDEINYRVPDGENLHDVFARVERFFNARGDLLNGEGNHLIVGHRNVNKMILKFVLGLSFEEGFSVEHEHQRLYFFFGTRNELWTCRQDDAETPYTQGYATIDEDSSYA